MKKIFIGIGGAARSGKDTFCSIAKKQLEQRGLKVKKMALADELKHDLRDFIYSKMGMDVYTQITAEKDIIRPLLVGYGDSMRKRTGGRYWIEKVNERISQDDADVIIVTDIRFDEFEKDELHWIKEELGGTVVHVSKYNIAHTFDDIPQKHFTPPANDHEARNDPKIKEKADIVIEWEHQMGDILNSSYLNNIVTNTLDIILSK